MKGKNSLFHMPVVENNTCLKRSNVDFSAEKYSKDIVVLHHTRKNQRITHKHWLGSSP
jgi:hypothetical protein